MYSGRLARKGELGVCNLGDVVRRRLRANSSAGVLGAHGANSVGVAPRSGRFSQDLYTYTNAVKLQQRGSRVNAH